MAPNWWCWFFFWACGDALLRLVRLVRLVLHLLLPAGNFNDSLRGIMSCSLPLPSSPLCPILPALGCLYCFTALKSVITGQEREESVQLIATGIVTNCRFQPPEAVGGHWTMNSPIVPLYRGGNSQRRRDRDGGGRGGRAKVTCRLIVIDASNRSTIEMNE